ncbi:OmpA family protein [Sulfitobacter aestuarii]|uniref:OmpA family protein n=1 Tax=Sulfitobacter aestuarii TaxID=2161676 RepID=A0ABW5U5V3_9RHOB
MTRLFTGLAALFCTSLAGPAGALDLTLPGNARQNVSRNTEPDRYAAPVGVFEDGKVEKISLEGEVRRTAWRLASPGLTPLQAIRPLRAQLQAADFEILLDCAADECGGFDFRFAVETLPGPNMYVDINSYHVVTGLRRAADGSPAEVVNLLASTSATSAYVQIIQAGDISGADSAPVAEASDPVLTETAPSDDAAEGLLARGHLVLKGLEFDTGTSELGAGPFAGLAALADLLKERADLRLALVGHTDTVGSLAANIALSKRRAEAVRRRLIEQYGIAADRLDAEGMGYLAPVASNLEADGREANRRVEAVLLLANE